MSIEGVEPRWAQAPDETIACGKRTIRSRWLLEPTSDGGLYLELDSCFAPVQGLGFGDRRAPRLYATVRTARVSGNQCSRPIGPEDPAILIQPVTRFSRKGLEQFHARALEVVKTSPVAQRVVVSERLGLPRWRSLTPEG